MITVTKGMNVPRFPTLRGKIAARQQEIQKFGAHSLSIPVDSIGLSGSPTRVVKVENFKIERKGKILKDMDPMLMADQLVQFLIERGAW